MSVGYILHIPAHSGRLFLTDLRLDSRGLYFYNRVITDEVNATSFQDRKAQEALVFKLSLDRDDVSGYQQSVVR